MENQGHLLLLQILSHENDDMILLALQILSDIIDEEGEIIDKI